MTEAIASDRLPRPRFFREPRALGASVTAALLGSAAAVAITFATYVFHFTFAAALIHLIVIVIAARRRGFQTATVISLAAFLSAVFVAPFPLSQTVTDARNWLALVVFEYCALVVGRLSKRAATQTAIAEERGRDVRNLFTASRDMLLMDCDGDHATRAAALIRSVFNCRAVVLFDGNSADFGVSGSAGEEVRARAQQTFVESCDDFDEQGACWYRVLRTGDRAAGALVLSGGQITEPLANAIAVLAGMALDRNRSLRNENRAHAERESERLRTAVLDSLAHEIKTPLTAIRAASSGMIEAGGLASYQCELVQLIDRQCERLTDITEGLLRIARLDSLEVRLECEAVRVYDVLRSIEGIVREKAPERLVHLETAESDCIVPGDLCLLRIALWQIVDNALKYSPPATAVSIHTDRRRREIVTSVHNFGAAIPASEHSKVFERFYRSPHTKVRIAGTGLGLSIARKIVVAHKGRIWLMSHDTTGTSVFIALPLLSSVKRYEHDEHEREYSDR